MTATATSTQSAGAGASAGTVDPEVLSWVNPSLGTALYGKHCSETLTDSLAALRAALAGAGFRVADEQVSKAKLAAGATSWAFRMAIADVFDMGVSEGPCFKVGAQVVANIPNGETSPSFRVSLLAQHTDEKAFLSSPYRAPSQTVEAWVRAFCSQLVEAVNP